MVQTTCLLVCCLALVSPFCHGLAIPRFRPPSHPGIPKERLFGTPHLVAKTLMEQCDEKYRTAALDHFNWGEGDLGLTTFQQRYFICDTHWNPNDGGKPGPIFFYLGNEADVELYLNATGLMWENAHDFGAMLIFAEHRYYGKSLPYGANVRKHMRYLSAEQAMADYAELIAEVKQQYNASESPVIGFGGSYGGMLAAWMRMKYPHVLDGSIAGSAPIWNFVGETPEFDPLSFSKGVTHDASAGGGAAAPCSGNVRRGWKVLEQLGESAEGQKSIASAMSLCPSAKLSSRNDVIALRDWLAAAWDYMAMGNFPYPSGYILNGHGELPPFPVRVACNQGLHQTGLSDMELMQGLAQAAGVYYNYSSSLSCFDFREGANPESDEDSDFWGYQYCTEMFMPFGKDGEADMFWSEPWDPEATAEGCKQTWGVTPRRTWATTQWGGRKIGAASNIAFSNGLLDPWHGGGVLGAVNPSMPAIIIPEGAHHLDLMFSHPDDPPSVREARMVQVRLMHQWIDQAHGKHPQTWKAESGFVGQKAQSEILANGRTNGRTEGGAKEGAKLIKNRESRRSGK